MSKFLIVGAGTIGSQVARLLGAGDHEVVVVSRRGLGPELEGVELVAQDATDGTKLSQLAHGASAIFNCANPPYHRWPTEWPPIAEALLAAAETSGATLVTLSNLYVYGVPTRPMRPTDPMDAISEKAQVRAKMWTDALTLHEAGRIRACEVRASDFVGANCDAMLGERAVTRIKAGKSVQIIGKANVAHSWTFTDDVARTLVTVALNESAWGRPWHVASNEPLTIQQVVDNLADAAGVRHVKTVAVPDTALRVVGLFNPTMRELRSITYQFEVPFIIDDRDTRDLLGLSPTPWNEVMAAAVGAPANRGSDV